MKGMIFTEFLDFVTDQLGVETCEEMIESCDLTDDGAYTAVGTYDHRELLEMVTYLSHKTDTPIPLLVQAFGKNLFGALGRKYPMFLEDIPDAFSLLKQIDDVIHVNVRKLYPDAELPSFSYEQPDESTLILNYESSRGLADVAVGLLQGCFEHFDEAIDLERIDLEGAPGTQAQFILRKTRSF